MRAGRGGLRELDAQLFEQRAGIYENYAEAFSKGQIPTKVDFPSAVKKKERALALRKFEEAMAALPIYSTKDN